MNRRRFLAHSARAATVAAASTVGLPRLARAQKSPGDTVVLGLVGAGGRGTALATGLAGLESVEFKAVCDVNQARGAALAGQLAARQRRAPATVGDMRRLLDDKDLDAVIVATPEHWHALATIWACQAGKDVYVEKNPSLSIGEGRKMIEAARKYRRIVQVGFQNRSAPYAASAREYLRSGKLGRVVLVKVYNLLYGTKQLMYLGRHGIGWQVIETDGKLVAEDKGVHPDKWHQPNFVECIRTRKLPNADIEQAHYSACLVHLANSSYRVGQRQLDFDPAAERFTNNDAANALLEPSYRGEYRVPDGV